MRPLLQRIFQKTIALLPLQLIVHGVSIAFSIGILALCASSLYFKDLTFENINTILNAFQLIATLHTTIVSSSFASITAYHLRYELCEADGLPLGLLVAPFRLSSIQVLFRREFWLAATAKTNTKRIYIFSAGILVSILLTVLTNSASAILIIPQLEWWPVNIPLSNVNGFSYLNTSHHNLWPSQIDVSFVPSGCVLNTYNIDQNLYCPYAGMANLARWATDYVRQFSPPNFTQTCDANILRYLGTQISPNSEGYSASSTSMSFLATTLEDIWIFAHRHNISLAKFARPMIKLTSSEQKRRLMRPLVHTKCGTPVDITTSKTVEVTFPPLNSTPTEVPFHANVSRRLEPKSFMSQHTKVSFVDISKEARRPTLGVLVGMGFWNASLLSPSFRGLLAHGLIPCTTSAYWVPTKVSYDPNAANVVILDNPNPLSILSSKDLMSQAQPVEIDISYANIVNSQIGVNGSSVLEYELHHFENGAAAYPDFPYDGDWGSAKWSWIVSTLISLQLSDALARVNELAVMEVLCEGQGCYDKTATYVQNIRQQNAPFSFSHVPHDDATTYNQGIKQHPELYTPVEWSVERYGYGWGFDRITKSLAAAAVILYILIVLTHLTLVLKRRWRYDRWEDLLELLILAVQSPPASVLDSVDTAGIVRPSTYTAPVRIRQSSSRQIPVLVVGGGQEARQARQLAPSKERP